MAYGRADVKSKHKTHSFFSGVVILAVSNLLVKCAGLMFKIPMNYIIGDTGMGYYNSAYSVYTFLYMLSTSGLPVAISVMVSENRSLGRSRSATRVLRIALTLFGVIGAATSAVMLFASDALCDLIGSERSAYSLMTIAPTMLFICISSAYRGYFQGCGNMVPTAVSQLIEAIFKLVLGVSAASYAIRCGYSIEVVAAFAVSGLTLGAFAGLIYLAVYRFLHRDRYSLTTEATADEGFDRSSVIRRFIKISLPITVSASVMSLTGMIDTALIQRVLQSSGMSEEMAATLFGNYTSLAVPMFNLPPVLVYPIAYSLVPIVASAFSSGKRERAGGAIEASIRTAVIIGLPCALGMAVLAEPILCLFYKESSAAIAAPLLSCLAPSSLFVCILAVTNSVLQGCGREKLTVISMLAGAVLKTVSGYVLIGRLGIIGAPISTFLCYLAVTLLNFVFVVRTCGVKFSFTGTFLKPLLASVLCAAAAYFSNCIFIPHVGEKLACVLAVILAAAVYAVAVLAMRAVTLGEIKSLIGTRRIGKETKNDGKNKRAQKQIKNRAKARL
ncbi:MAG: polysaccharide biosynthesis protein [Clostridia bacterium]|nr:polysaccharide biosynthesis protein [Clostridia bacterium]